MKRDSSDAVRAKLLAVRLSVACLALTFCASWPAIVDAQARRQPGRARRTTQPAAVRSVGAASGPGGVITIGDFKAALPDVELSAQDGGRVRLYSDLMKGKVVVLSFFYTSCEYVCSIQGRNLFQLQTLLGPRLGRDVSLVSITRSPQVDTPRRLKAWAGRNGVRRGWTLVTGNRRDVGRLLRVLTGDPLGQPEGHSTRVYIGNEAAGVWTYSDGLLPPEKLMEVIDSVSGGARQKQGPPAP